MNDESLSALLDGECGPGELDLLLTQMNRDPALRQRFGRMALAQQARRGALGRPIPADFADRVLAALPERPDPVVVPLARRVPWQPAAGLAAAAALGAVAVLALKPETETAPGAASATADASPADPVAVTQVDDENARQLRNYLMAYSQSRGQQGMGGTLGYARYAAYTVDGAPGDDDEQGGSR